MLLMQTDTRSDQGNSDKRSAAATLRCHSCQRDSSNTGTPCDQAQNGNTDVVDAIAL